MKPFFAPVLCAVAVMAGTTLPLPAQPLRVLHDFSELQSPWPYTNWDGAQPYHTGVVLVDHRLYGTTYYGGTNGNGSVFSLRTDGGDFTVLHAFSRSQSPAYTNADGEYPQGGFVLAGDTLYGTTLNGGTQSGGYGVVFGISTNGTTYSTLHSFDNVSDGRNPAGPLLLADNRLYGVAEVGGSGDSGTIFAVNLDGSGFTVLHALTNAEGELPYAGLALSGDTLYGTANYGGVQSEGTVFSVKTNGQGFTVLHLFSPAPSPGYTNADGCYPEGTVAVAGGRLYGTATEGGSYAHGTIFSMSMDGTDYQVLHVFDGTDGDWPLGLLLVNDMVYGVTESGGANDTGTLFGIHTNGDGFAVLRHFDAVNYLYYTNSSGVNPEGDLVREGHTLYGTTEYGGAGGSGTVFSFTLAPRLVGLTFEGADVVLHGDNGLAGDTCVVLRSREVTAPVASWTPVATNVLSASSFTIVVPNEAGGSAAQRFYTLQVR